MFLELYSDINKKTPLQKSRIINAESIKNSILNLLNIKDKDILFSYNKNNIPDFIFANINSANAFSLMNTIISLFKNEPRVSLNLRESDVVPDVTNSTYNIYLNYTFNNSTTPEDLHFTIKKF